MAIYSGFTHWKWWFSIVMLVYQRVNLPRNLQRFHGKCWFFVRCLPRNFPYISHHWGSRHEPWTKLTIGENGCSLIRPSRVAWDGPDKHFRRKSPWIWMNASVMFCMKQPQFHLDDMCLMFRGMELWGYFLVLFCESSKELELKLLKASNSYGSCRLDVNLGAYNISGITSYNQ